MTYFPNCDAVHAAGFLYLFRDDPGYRPGLDRDSDGLACEPADTAPASPTPRATCGGYGPKCPTPSKPVTTPTTAPPTLPLTASTNATVIVGSVAVGILLIVLGCFLLRWAVASRGRHHKRGRVRA